MNKSKTHLAEYINLVSLKLQGLQKEFQSRERYQISAIENNHEQVRLTIHITGTGKEIVCAPEELALDDNMLEGFSKKNIRLITYYACRNLNKPKSKIIATTFCGKIKKIFFKVMKIKSDELIEKTANEISEDAELISSLSAHDAHKVGYVYGSESVLFEKSDKLKASDACRIN